MNVVIIGAGAMGCLFGAGLSRHNEVTLLCLTQAEADAINNGGLTVYEPDGRICRYQEHVTARPTGTYTEKADLLIVLTKTMDTDAAVGANRHLIDDHTLVLTLQNGGGNAEKLEKYCAKEQIFIGTTKHNCVDLQNGTVRHSGSGITYIGADAPGVSVAPVAELLTAAGFTSEASDNILHLVWEKLFVNLSINSFTAITKAPIGACISTDHAWYYMEKLISEAVEVAAACGQEFSRQEILDMVRTTCIRVYTGFSSMSQDVLSHRRTEIDSINGYVVEQAKLHGIAAPYNELIVHLVHAIEHTYQTNELPVIL